MKLLLASALVLAALPLGGCGEGGGERESTAPSEDELLITFTRSGGFAPIFEEMVIEADGDAVLTTGGFRPRDQQVTEFSLEEAELTALTAAVAEDGLEDFEPGGGVCSDCYEYSVVTAEDEAKFSSLDLDNQLGAIVPPELKALIAELSKIAVNHAPPIADDARGSSA